MAEKIQSIPEAKLLLTSLRSVGYNEETAIADIIDNCISAQAHKIKIQFDWGKKRIVISDDGFGMNKMDLIENMRIGSSEPSKTRAKDDLGRFGMGMKTAAFSLGKKLTVVTKSDSVVSNASWDLDQIPEYHDLVCSFVRMPLGQMGEMAIEYLRKKKADPDYPVLRRLLPCSMVIRHRAE